MKTALTIAIVVTAAAGCHKSPSKLAREARRSLAEHLHPVALKNCNLVRVGSKYDGGYLMCDNLLGGAVSAYSYGIDTEDNWGCQLATKLGVPIHQYDCFTPFRPTCAGGKFDYHDECIGDKAETLHDKPFDTLTHQIEKNGDAGKHVIVKIDVEGAEWDSLLATPDEVLANIDQLPMEMHGVDQAKYTKLVEKLERTFYMVSFHFNNWGCSTKLAPMPSSTFQVLWVNKHLAQVDPSGAPHVAGAAPDAPDNPDAPDCQVIQQL